MSSMDLTVVLTFDKFTLGHVLYGFNHGFDVWVECFGRVTYDEGMNTILWYKRVVLELSSHEVITDPLDENYLVSFKNKDLKDCEMN